MREGTRRTGVSEIRRICPAIDPVESRAGKGKLCSDAAKYSGCSARTRITNGEGLLPSSYGGHFPTQMLLG